MTLITIRETGSITDSPNAFVSFDRQGEYPITITNPFSKDDEKDLEWYFEKYLRFPFLEGVRVDKAEKSILAYGQALFEQVFKDRDAYGQYAQARQNGIENIQFEIEGSSGFFHQMHWEALKDPKWPNPFVLEAPMVRSIKKSSVIQAQCQPSPTINLLIVTARPDGRQDVGYRTISQPLVESLQQAKIPVNIDILRPGTYKALTDHLDSVRDKHGKGYYHIIHFDLHGALETYEQLKQDAKADRLLFQKRYGRKDYPSFEGQKAFLFFETDKSGQADPAEATEVAELLISHQIPIVVLNACQSGKLTEYTESSLGSRLLEAGVQTVVAMSYSVTVSAASRMMSELYSKLVDRADLAHALCHARKALADEKDRRAYFNQTINLEDWMLPVVYQSGGAKAKPALNLRDFKPVEQAEYWERLAELYEAPEPTYGFVGRDLDILEAERRVLSTSEGKRRNILLIQGMGGSGKTTLLKHLMEWWQTTGFVQEMFYFGYDERAWSLEQIMYEIAQKLLADKPHAPRTFRLESFMGMNQAAQGKMLGNKLRSEHHLLVLDNMESITGTNLAIKNTLKPEEQQALRSFLSDLLGGETIVLLSSRGSEEWLAEGSNAPLRKNDIYSLPGLDTEAASTLAERVLERHIGDSEKRSKYRQSDDFKELLKILDGYPLPIQVVMANLSSQEPSEILKAFKEGGMIQDGTIPSKTENIMLCIDYSHGNLAPEAQRLLMCLAPFTGVVYKLLIEKYTKYLKAQPALADLRFDMWGEVFKATEAWGLITLYKEPGYEVPGYLRLQPVLPYFLRIRLNQEPQMRQAIETAFRQIYDVFGYQMSDIMQSKQPDPKQAGQALAMLEYENLITALELDLKAQVSVSGPYSALSRYLDITKDQSRGLELGEKIMAGLEGYPPAILEGQIGFDIVAVMSNEIAERQLKLKKFSEAEASYQKALKLLDCLMNIDEKSKADAKAVIYHNLGRVAQEQIQWNQAEDYYKKAIEIKIELNDRYNQASTYHQLGIVAKGQRQWNQAEDYYKKAIEIYIEFNDRYGQAMPYLSLGVMAQEQRQLKLAEDYYKKALEIYIEFNDRYDQAGTYHNLGMVAQEQRQLKQAEDYYKKALGIYVEFNDRYDQASNYYQLGTVAQEQRQWNQAEDYYKKALEICVEFSDRYNQAKPYHNLGMVAQEQRQLKQAEDYYKKALEICVEFNDRYNQAKPYHQLGMVAQEQRQLKQAEDYYKKALEICIEFNDQPSGTVVLSSLSRLWKATTDERILAEIAQILSISQEDVKEL